MLDCTQVIFCNFYNYLGFLTICNLWLLELRRLFLEKEIHYSYVSEAVSILYINLSKGT